MEENKLKDFAIIVIVGLIFLGIGYFIGSVTRNKINNDKTNVQLQDTTYNRVTIDSIKYNIIKKDSIIYNIKEDAKEEIEYAINANDSTTLMLFQKLVSE